MIILAYDAALRREEVIKLRVDDIDWSRAILKVRADVAKNGRARMVPFSGFTELLLKRYIETDRQLLVDTFGGEQTGALFLSESTACPGQPLAVGAFNDIIENVRDRLELPHLTPHTLRHQRCTILKRAGVPLDDVALFAGHKSTETTRIYIHIAPTELGKTIREKSKRFDSFMERTIMEHIR
jgi:integrase